MEQDENALLEYHRNSHDYFREAYIDMQKRYSKLNHKYMSLKNHAIVRSVVCGTIGLVVGWMLHGILK